MNKGYTKYLIAIISGLAVAYAVAQSRGLFTAEEPQLIAQYVSDAFFVPSVFLIGFGAITWVSTTGFFDIFGYAAKSVFNRFFHPGKSDPNGTYYDYVVAREEKRGEAQPFLLFVGLGFLLAAGIAYIVYASL